jgi:hypothetical protein
MRERGAPGGQVALLYERKRGFALNLIEVSPKQFWNKVAALGI